MSMMLALFPFCIFVLAVAAQLSAEVSDEAIVAIVFGTWPEEIAAPIVGEVVAVLEQSSAQTALLSAIWQGILLNIFMWCAIGFVFSIYIQTFADYSMTYAGLAGIMAALIFMYIMAAVFVFCAEFNGQLQKPTTARVRNSDKGAG